MTIPNIIQVPHALFSTLNAVSAVTDLLGTFKSLPCLFTAPIVPSGAPKPYIHIRPPIGLVDIGTKNSNGWQVTEEIVIVSNENEDDKIYEIADLVLESINRATLTLTTDTNLFTVCVGMTHAIVSDDLNGLILTFNVSIVD